jgi:integrase
MTFEELFREWHQHNSQSERNPSGWSYAYALDTRQRVEKWLLPAFGDRPLEEITPREIISVLKEVEAGGALETLKRLRQYACRIYKYGIGLGYCEWNPAADLPSDIFAKQQKTNYAHLTKSAELRQLFKAIESYCGDISTKVALTMAPYVFLRPKELAALEWSEIDLNKGVIEIKADRMKKKRAHIVPISKQVNAWLEEQARYSSGSKFVFRSPRTEHRPISEQSLNAALHRIGFKGLQTVHGFRHTASTILNELGFNRDWIEKQLAHEEANQVRGTYNKAEYLKERASMMQAYANHLDGIKAGADVVPLHGHLKG